MILSTQQNVNYLELMVLNKVEDHLIGSCIVSLAKKCDDFLKFTYLLSFTHFLGPKVKDEVEQEMKSIFMNSNKSLNPSKITEHEIVSEDKEVILKNLLFQASRCNNLEGLEKMIEKAAANSIPIEGGLVSLILNWKVEKLKMIEAK